VVDVNIDTSSLFDLGFVLQQIVCVELVMDLISGVSLVVGTINALNYNCVVVNVIELSSPCRFLSHEVTILFIAFELVFGSVEPS
jgi:hypothetical protein